MNGINILVITTGGTIDAEPHPVAPSPNGESIRIEIKPNVTVKSNDPTRNFLKQQKGYNVRFDDGVSLIKDSKYITHQQLIAIAEAIRNAPEDKILVTMGTDRIAKHAMTLEKMLEGSGKRVVMTGAFLPLKQDVPYMEISDGAENLREALRQLDKSEPGVYVVIPDRLESLVKHSFGWNDKGRFVIEPNGTQDGRPPPAFWRAGERTKDTVKQEFVPRREPSRVIGR